MYSEFLTDPVIRLLSFEDQRHFVAVLCMKCSGVLDKIYTTPGLRTEIISSLIGLAHEPPQGGDVSALERANKRLRDRGLIDEHWQPVNWDKRQFQSDTSAARTRKWRERHSDVTVTRQSRADTEQIQSRGGSAPKRKWKPGPEDSGSC
jgi:hypothetical protein